jgi:predicted  nucleic acid-binding Zn-ribbon protein
MGLDELPQQFDALVEAARVALHGEVTSAKAVVARANAEKTAAANVLADLQAQIRATQNQLNAVLSNLHRAEGLVGINTEIAGVRKTLDALKIETEAKRKDLAGLVKQCTEREASVVALNNEVSQLGARRAHDQEIMAKIRSQLGV